MKVLIACEESQEVCKAFRARGHEGGKSRRWMIKGIISMLGTCSLHTRHAHTFQTPEHDTYGKATSYKRTA